ncbi:LacI family transcriptional regulator [Streptomyces phaeoluteigriseus]|uniref:LacI family transcriptional regulator n=1 Tax=Streptomyces phaeoluteigriseus TaxID=114686 RepID=A0ABY4ZBI8_9ACTN|nr:LacI family DNA-binding transcriptional regulator [Streptomyces phaeoluteigriseus]USQ86194.1 LacI family transcriptional regulator [Streptomyces phaeoluteigriseus]
MPSAAYSPPTLAQIARLAGVSVPTVSRVANKRKNVSPATRLRVEAVMRRTGYARKPRPRSAAAASLVDVVVPDIGSRWAAEFLRGAEEAAAREELSLVVSALCERGTSGRPRGGWLDRVCARGTAGMLLTSVGLTPSQQLWLSRQGIPSVLVDPAGEPPPGVPTVRTGHQAGARAATEHLLRLGHRRIALLGGHRSAPDEGRRLAGYQAALTAAGLAVRPEYVRFAGSGIERTRRAADDLLSLATPPTAICAGTDEMAIGVYWAAARRGLSVPRDVSVVGFGDAVWAGHALPALTTVRQPVADMASWGIRALVTMMSGAPVDARAFVTPVRLVARRSTACPARAPRTV